MPTHQDRESAQDTLAYIRRTMESASSFTAVSGWGLITVGFVGLAASWIAWRNPHPADLRIWLPTAGVCILVAAISNIAKARRTAVPIWSGAIRRLVWVIAPALAAGGVLTAALTLNEAFQLLPGMWLALYGAGVTAGAEFSIRAIRWMGVSLLILGAIALLHPAWGLTLMACGFGGLHVLIGLDIVMRHGG